MVTEVKQPVAWELRGRFREFVGLRPKMQQEEWEVRFSEFWPHQLKDLRQPEARQEMFSRLSSNGLVQRHYASELNGFITNNEGWQAKIADLSLVCGAFPICEVGVCHHRSIEHRKGYEDKNGRSVPPHSVRSFFGHRGRLPERFTDIHKADMDQIKHDTAIDTMISHLLRHRSGFYVVDRCLKCKKEFEALRIWKPEDFRPKFRENDDQGNLKFEFDIGVIGEGGKLEGIIEALNTHKMGAEKRIYADNQGYPWIEYSVPALLSNEWKGALRSMPDGWLALQALKLKITHSGITRCQTCTAEFERERAAADRQERMRRKIREGEETRRRTMKELVEPAERDIDQATRVVETMEPGFSTINLNNLELDLGNAQVLAKEIQDRLRQAEQVTTELQDIEVEADTEVASIKGKSFCSKTGLELSTEYSGILVRKFKELSVRIDQANYRCHELLTLIGTKRQELMSLREWLQ